MSNTKLRFGAILLILSLVLVACGGSTEETVEELLGTADIKVFVDVPDKIRFKRRLSRDIKKRGRTLMSVTNQYESTVYPMYKQFVEPSKDFADIIITGGAKNKEAIDTLINNINVLL